MVQLLSTKIDDFTVEADCGGGRWEYANAVATFLRDVMVEQRNGIPATFEYTTRGWKLNVFVVSMPFEDSVNEVLRTFSIQMKVQEDVSGVMTRNSLSAELRRLQDGLAYPAQRLQRPHRHREPGRRAAGLRRVLHLPEHPGHRHHPEVHRGLSQQRVPQPAG